MIDLKDIIMKYPRCLATRSQLASFLRDLYPEQKREINIALVVYDSGIPNRMARLNKIDALQYHFFLKKLVDNFGLQERFAAIGIEIWAKAFELIIETNSSSKD